MSAAPVPHADVQTLCIPYYPHASADSKRSAHVQILLPVCSSANRMLGTMFQAGGCPGCTIGACKARLRTRLCCDCFEVCRHRAGLHGLARVRLSLPALLLPLPLLWLTCVYMPLRRLELLQVCVTLSDFLHSYCELSHTRLLELLPMCRHVGQASTA